MRRLPQLLLVLTLCAPIAAAAPTLSLAGKPATVTASSELPAKKTPGAYAVDKLFDGKLETAWSEGVDGTGAGSRITISWTEPVKLEGLAFVPGYAKSAALFAKNAAPRVMHLELDGAAMPPFTIGYPLKMDMGTEDDPKAKRDMGCYHTEAGFKAPWRLLLFDDTRTVTRLDLVIDEALMGSAWADMLISELVLFEADKAPAGLPADVLRAAEVLGELRDGRTPASLYADTVAVHAAEPGRAEARFMAMLEGKEVKTDPAQLSAAEAAPPDSPAGRWWAAMKPHLYNKAVAVTDAGLVGPLAERYGDGEWVELYPRVTLDASGRMTSLGDASYYDGSPGCHDLIP